jgi:hypothetical protein
MVSVPSMNRLNQTEPATFSILLCWTFFRDSFYLCFSELCPGQRSRYSSRSCALHIYPLRYIYLQSLMFIYLNIFCSFRVIPRTKFFKKERYFKNWAEQSYGILVLHFYSMGSIYKQSFMLISLIILEKCPRYLL